MIKQTNFNLFPEEILPKGFKYPAQFISLSKDTSSINGDEYFQWWFDDADTSAGELAYSVRNNFLNDFNLVPFAKNGDWIANFDGSDTSGNPRVIIVDLGDLPFHMFCDNFDDWLAKAEQDYW